MDNKWSIKFTINSADSVMTVTSSRFSGYLSTDAEAKHEAVGRCKSIRLQPQQLDVQDIGQPIKICEQLYVRQFIILVIFHAHNAAAPMYCQICKWVEVVVWGDLCVKN